MKKKSLIALIPFITVLFSCGNNEISSILSGSKADTGSDLSSVYEPETELERAFLKMRDGNNFTLQTTELQPNNDYTPVNETYYFTDYSLQAEGDKGFMGVAQGRDVIFRYTIKDGDIVSGAPLINQFTGSRYESIFSYTYTFKDLDVSKLPKTKNDDGYYYYQYGRSEKNDLIMDCALLRLSSKPVSEPTYLKFKVVGGVIMGDACILDYGWGDPGMTENHKFTSTFTVYDIGSTENKEIKAYLDSGKTSKKPLDMRFFNFINPYLMSENYKIDMDSRGMPGNTFYNTELCTPNALIDYQNGSKSGYGYMLHKGVVHRFTLDENDNLAISGTVTDEDYNFYTSIYLQMLSYSFEDLSFSNFVGYIDDDNPNLYYLTDSQLIYGLSYLCYVQTSDEMSCKEIMLEIIDDDTHEFKLHFPLKNRLTNRELGTYTCRFYDMGKVEIPAVDEYVSPGDDPTTQTTSDLVSVLNEFKKNNYSFECLSSVGLAKYVCTENYFYCSVYGSDINNYGFLKEDGHIYEFSIDNGVMNIDRTVDHKDSIKLPGVGAFLLSDDDCGYMSTLDSELYNERNYEVDEVMGTKVWKINNSTLSSKIFNYIWSNPRSMRPYGTGLLVKNVQGKMKLSFYSTGVYTSGTYAGYYNQDTITYFDIGTSSVPVVEEYLRTK
ncbi:MAG: hypothetical protein MJ238_07060 [Bacilli bacterium]|nr:hypothetical protein [Bacilli bacterium]